MRVSRTLGGSAVAALAVAGIAVLAVFGLTRSTQANTTKATSPVERIAASTGAAWPERELRGSTVLTGQVPLAVASGKAKLVGSHAGNAQLKLRFGLPIHDQAKLNALIAAEAKTHQYLSAPADLRRLRAADLAGRRAAHLAPGQGLQDHARRCRPARADGRRVDRDRAEGARRQDQRLRPSGHEVRRDEGRPVPVLLRDEGADGACLARHPEHLGPERRQPLLHAGAAQLREPELDPGRRRLQRQRRGQRGHQSALHRGAQRRLLPGRPARPLRRHRPRLRRHRPDDRLHAVDGPREAGGDDQVRAPTPATS